MTSVNENSLEPATVAAPPASPAISIENVARHYTMGETTIRAIDGVSLQIAEGDFVALLGSSGSGKSSLLNLIAGLDRPSGGSIVVQGSDLAKLSRFELAQYRLRTVGMVFQSFNLIPSMTVHENVELPLRFAEIDRLERARVSREAIERVGLVGRIDHKPTQLSGGEQQRVALARAFMVRPPILMADEPTGNLDSENGRQVLDMLLSLNRDEGTTLVLVTHDRELASSADRRVTLKDGRMVGDERLARAL
jgi:putative ABC transport system ATP-binding protein